MTTRLPRARDLDLLFGEGGGLATRGMRIVRVRTNVRGSLHDVSWLPKHNIDTDDEDWRGT